MQIPQVMRDMFERGYVPHDSPPGIEEHLYKQWGAEGGKVTNQYYNPPCDDVLLSIEKSLHMELRLNLATQFSRDLIHRGCPYENIAERAIQLADDLLKVLKEKS